MNMPSVHAISVTELAAVADALIGDGRPDLAANFISVMYYCAERQIDDDNVVPFRTLNGGYG